MSPFKSPAPLTLDLAVGGHAAASAIEQAAHLCGADWLPDSPLDRSRADGAARPEGDRSAGGELKLPVVAGLRRGVLECRIRLYSRGSTTRVEMETMSSEYHLQWQAAIVLFLGSFSGLMIVLAPLSPVLLELVPIAGVLLLAAWFLVGTRFKHRGPREFLDLVAQVAQTDMAEDDRTTSRQAQPEV